MNNIIGELFPKIMSGYFKLEIPPQRQQSYPDELFSQSSHASVFSIFIKKPNRVGMPKYTCRSMSALAQAVQGETAAYDFVADRYACQGGCYWRRWRQSYLCVFALWIAMFSGLFNIQTLYLG
ncbi:hypothetical protein [Methylobacter sp. YRD-M1]|uniref:hypothetical protein n=1 Tax=Methylobacter sp. YRD-M1 TaxID=2911520 RepID=UPI00227B593E|nr:hypothetical protein [Methylobacter sp. YRD-M1]WAK00574.1 hypothetical protein LZ558_12005 [Methylobacter sp. YRD-M1]